MTDPKELLVTALHKKENSRPRSNQVQIGPSELGGCRRKVWYRLNDQPETNDNALSYPPGEYGRKIKTQRN